ncbi:MAG: GNAT family N-acetyltransferase [Pyrinomonadaceae bacterium]
MNVTIRKARPDDIAGIHRLMREFAEFEKLLEYFRVTEQRLADVLFGDEAFVECLVAQSGDDLCGYAIFYPNFATFSGERGLYLEDIYIERARRGGGLGRALLGEIARTALERGLERIDFQVLDWNVPAIGFYRDLGAVANDGETHFKFGSEALARLAG